MSRALAGLAEFGRARLTLTAGDVGPDGDPARPPAAPPRLLLQVWPLEAPAMLPAARLIPIEPGPTGDGVGPGGHKTMAWFGRVHALQLARAAGGDEGVHRTWDGRVLGASRANIFIVRDGGLLTPAVAGGALPGITRALLISTLAPALGIAVREADLTLADLRDAEAMLLTNALWGIRPAAWDPPGAAREGHPLVRQLVLAGRDHLHADCGVPSGSPPGGC